MAGTRVKEEIDIHGQNIYPLFTLTVVVVDIIDWIEKHCNKNVW